MVTMYNPQTDVTVRGIHASYINSWISMGFMVVAYESKNITLLRKAS